MMGDVLDAAEGKSIRITVEWESAPVKALLDFIVNGTCRETLEANESGFHEWELAGGRDRWCLVTLHDENDVVLALTNPIFLDGSYKKSERALPALNFCPEFRQRTRGVCCEQIDSCVSQNRQVCYRVRVLDYPLSTHRV